MVDHPIVVCSVTFTAVDIRVTHITSCIINISTITIINIIYINATIDIFVCAWRTICDRVTDIIT